MSCLVLCLTCLSIQVFGKVNRFIRPSDPITLLPSSIAFVTYAQSICGLRCLNILNGVNVDLEGGEQFIEVKAGVKDSNILVSVQNVSCMLFVLCIVCLYDVSVISD